MKHLKLSHLLLIALLLMAAFVLPACGGEPVPTEEVIETTSEVTAEVTIEATNTLTYNEWKTEQAELSATPTLTETPTANYEERLGTEQTSPTPSPVRTENPNQIAATIVAGTDDVETQIADGVNDFRWSLTDTAVAATDTSTPTETATPSITPDLDATVEEGIEVGVNGTLNAINAQTDTPTATEAPTETATATESYGFYIGYVLVDGIRYDVNETEDAEFGATSQTRHLYFAGYHATLDVDSSCQGSLTWDVFYSFQNGTCSLRNADGEILEVSFTVLNKRFQFYLNQ